MKNLTALGHSGVRVSTLCLGTMTFGGRTDDNEAHRIYVRAREAGINFLDTADVYNDGRSEEVTGRLVRDERDSIILATKIASAFGKDPNQRGLSRRWMMEGVAGSLRRLGTDRIDILYLHREDPFTPLEETVRAIEDLVRAGDIRYIGVSNYKAWRVAEIVRLCGEANITRPVVCQPYYHALYRVIEEELLPACRHFGIGVVPYSPLARGVLSGKYSAATLPEDSRAAYSDKRIVETELKPETIELAARFVARAKSRGVTPSAYAVAFILANALVNGAIVGPRTLAQFEAYLGASDVPWTDADEAFVNTLVPPGSTAVHHYVDPSYPIEGRVMRR